MFKHCPNHGTCHVHAKYPLTQSMSFGCQNFNILYRSSLDPDMINYLCIFHVLHCPNHGTCHVHAKYPMTQPKSFRLPEFQYSVPILATPRYNELHMYFLCLSIAQIMELAMCMPNIP